MGNITEREQEVYDCVVKYYEEFGFSPSLQDICERAYISSLRTVQERLRSLEDKGYIELPFPNHPRTIRVVGMKHTL